MSLILDQKQENVYLIKDSPNVFGMNCIRFEIHVNVYIYIYMHAVLYTCNNDCTCHVLLDIIHISNNTVICTRTCTCTCTCMYIMYVVLYIVLVQCNECI